MNIQTILREEMIEKSGKNGFLPFEEVDLQYMMRKEGIEELTKGFSFHYTSNPSEQETYDQVTEALHDAISKLSVPLTKCHSIILDLKIIPEYGTLNRLSIIEHFMKQHLSEDAVWAVTCAMDENLPNNVTNQILLYVKH